jgi:hypothetical protein
MPMLLSAKKLDRRLTHSSMDQILDRYTEPELEVLADFVRRTASAGRVATDELGAG